MKQFNNREALIAHVRTLSPDAVGNASPIAGGHRAAKTALSKIDPINYGKSRNFSDGAVTRLSPYISHGIMSLNQIRAYALKKCQYSAQITKFIQELAWRDFWQRLAKQNPDWVWQDVEPYKTGYTAQDYHPELPEDIKTASTDLACINSFIQELVTTGYLHNHARLYLASYIIHFRRVKWQAGAQWFLTHLLDGDEASNNFSWQWVASTFSNKPYIATLDNIAYYFSKHVDTSPERNVALATDYDTLTKRLFPNL